MKKQGTDTNILKDAEVDEILLLLEEAYANTGHKSIFRILEILMIDTYKEVNNFIPLQKNTV